MPKTQYFTATSLDGFIADADHSLDWLTEADARSDRADEHGITPFEAFFAHVGAFAMGATTYEGMLAQEDLLRQPHKWTDWYGDVPAWIFTHRRLPPVPRARLTWASGDVRPVHHEMVSAAGDKNIWIVGGGDLAGSFADASLLDELILGVAPVTLGAGAQLLPRRLTSDRLSLATVARRGQFAYLTYAISR